MPPANNDDGAAAAACLWQLRGTRIKDTVVCQSQQVLQLQQQQQLSNSSLYAGIRLNFDSLIASPRVKVKKVDRIKYCKSSEVR